MVLGYLRVSTKEQDLLNQKNAIFEYAKDKKILIDDFISVQISSRKDFKKRKLNEIIDRLDDGDMLIISELSRIGRSVTEVIDIINTLIEKNVRVVCIKENIDLREKQTIQSKLMITMFGLFAELERDLISQRTKEALKTRKDKGIKLGRPKGPGKSKIDPHKEDIQNLLDKDLPIASIAKLLDIKYFTLLAYIKKRKMKKNKGK